MKITALEQKTFQGKPSGFKVTLDDGTNGNLNEKESDKGLRVGDEVVVTLIPYTSKAGVTSNLLGLRMVKGAPVIPSNNPSVISSPVANKQTTAPVGKLAYDQMKADLRREVIRVLGSLASTGKIEPKEMVTYFAEYYPAVDLSIDELIK